MAEKWCVFLRGINVNGISIKMDALEAAFRDMGFPAVRTVLATGNVIVSPPDGDTGWEALRARIESGLSARFCYDAHVLLRDAEEIRAVCADAGTLPAAEGCHQYHLLCDDAALPAELEALFGSVGQLLEERFAVLGSGAFWMVPKGFTLKSEFGTKVLGAKKYKDRLTSRNISTIEKVRKLMQN